MKNSTTFPSVCAFVIIIVSFNAVSVKALQCYRCVSKLGEKGNCFTGENPSELMVMTCPPPPEGHKSFCSVRANRPKTKEEETLPRGSGRTCTTKDANDKFKCKEIGPNGRIECFCDSDNCNKFTLLETPIWKAVVRARQGISPVRPQFSQRIYAPGEEEAAYKAAKYEAMARYARKQAILARARFRSQSTVKPKATVRPKSRLVARPKILPRQNSQRKSKPTRKPNARRRPITRVRPKTGVRPEIKNRQQSVRKGETRYSDAKFESSNPYRTRAGLRSGPLDRPESRLVPYGSLHRFRPNNLIRSEDRYKPYTPTKSDDARFRPYSLINHKEDRFSPYTPIGRKEDRYQPYTPIKPAEDRHQPYTPIKPAEDRHQPYTPIKPAEDRHQPYTPIKPAEDRHQPYTPIKPAEDRHQPYTPIKPAEDRHQPYTPIGPQEDRHIPYTPIISRPETHSMLETRFRPETHPMLDARYRPDPLSRFEARNSPETRPLRPDSHRGVVQPSPDLKYKQNRTPKVGGTSNSSGNKKSDLPLLSVAERVKLEEKIKLEVGYSDPLL